MLDRSHTALIIVCVTRAQTRDHVLLTRATAMARRGSVQGGSKAKALLPPPAYLRRAPHVSWSCMPGGVMQVCIARRRRDASLAG